MSLCSACVTCLRGEAEIQSKTDHGGLPCMKHHSSLAKLLDSVGSGCILCVGFWSGLGPNIQHTLLSYRRVHDMQEQSFWSVLECHYGCPSETEYFRGWPVGMYYFEFWFNFWFCDSIPEIYVDKPSKLWTYYRLYAVPSFGSSTCLPAQCWKFR